MKPGHIENLQNFLTDQALKIIETLNCTCFKCFRLTDKEQRNCPKADRTNNPIILSSVTVIYSEVDSFLRQALLGFFLS